jgi:hypothetical protein
MRRLTEKLAIHYTPKHGSRVNMAKMAGENPLIPLEQKLGCVFLLLKRKGGTLFSEKIELRKL